MKKIMFFAYDGTGLGHLMRLIKIALGLSNYCKVLVVSGHKALPNIIPDGIEYALIPNFVEMRDKMVIAMNRQITFALILSIKYSMNLTLMPL